MVQVGDDPAPVLALAPSCQRLSSLSSGSFADSVIAYHTDFKDDFGVNMPMSVANDPLVGHLPTA